MKRPRIIVQSSLESPMEVPTDEVSHDRATSEDHPDATSEPEVKESSHLLHPPPSPLVPRPAHHASASSISAASTPAGAAALGKSNLQVDEQQHQHKRLSMADLIPALRPKISTNQMLAASKKAFLQSLRQQHSLSSVSSNPVPSRPQLRSNYNSIESGGSDNSNKHGGANAAAPLRSNSPSPLFTYSTDYAYTGAAAGAAHQPTSGHKSYVVRRQHSSASTLRRQTSVVENTIPLTTTFVQRMNKRSQIQSGQGSSGYKVLAQPKISSDRDYLKRKYGVTANPNEACHISVMAAKQRVGSFRSRLKKQNPVLWDSESSAPDTLNQSTEAAWNQIQTPQDSFQRMAWNTSSQDSTSGGHHALSIGYRKLSTTGVNLRSTRCNEEHHDAMTKRWSVSSETEANRPNQIFFRFGSTTGIKSASSSRDDDPSEQDGARVVHSSTLSPSSAIPQQPPSSLALTSSTATDDARDIYLSVPYQIIKETDT